MKPGTIAGATGSLSAPKSWTEQQDGVCEPLTVRREGQVLKSAWFPTGDELVALARGAPLVLSVWGNGHPPVALEVEVLPPIAVDPATVPNLPDGLSVCLAVMSDAALDPRDALVLRRAMEWLERCANAAELLNLTQPPT